MNPEHKHVDWAQRYRDEQMPWDRGKAHASLQASLNSGQLAPPREGATCLVPGCGRGHDALALAEAGWKVTGVDLVADLGTDFGERIAALGGEFIVGDALNSKRGAFDLVWEHTFLCAIAPYQRKAWSEMVRGSVRPGGRFGALIFPGDKSVDLGGPPWGYDVERLQVWLGPDFELELTEVVDPEVEPRSWKQTFALFRRAQDVGK